MTHTILDTSNLVWGRAKKTVGILAKPVSSVITDRRLLKSMLIDTLEGREPLHEENFLCIGAIEEPWQQSPKALFKKYNIVGITADGWLQCEPKPENEVEYIQFTGDGAKGDEAGLFTIIGLWGEEINGVSNQQRIKVGDYICRQTYDHNDQWVVNKGLFEATYSVL